MAATRKSAVRAVKSAVKKATGRSRTAAKTNASAGGAKTATKAASAKKTGPAKKSASAKKSAPTKKVTAKKSAPAKKAPAKKAPAKKAAAKKSAPAKKAAAKKAPAKKAPAKKASAKQTAPATRTASAPAKKATTVKTAPAKKSAAAKPSPGRLAVREGERAWTAKEIAEVRSTLEGDAERLQEEISAAEKDISHLLREGGEGAGNDQADVGANTFERDHEMSMAKNAREQLVLVKAALRRIDEATYGICASCGNPIGKMRLQAFPRATLCMECKQRQERR